MKDKVEEILEDRAKDYGSYEGQIEAITKVMNALRGLRSNSLVIDSIDTENFFLTMKLCRLQTSPTKTDTFDDLHGYLRLAQERRGC